jgi:hypothetical protein
MCPSLLLRWRLGLAGLLLALTGTLGRAQVPDAATPAPYLSHLTPLAITRGATIEVTFAGTDLEDPVALVFDHPGLIAKPVIPPTPPAPPAPKAEPGKPAPMAPPAPPRPPVTKFTVTAGADVPFGWHDVRLVGRYGVSNPHAFLVSGLPEAQEIEPNNDVPEAKPIAAESAAQGTIAAGTDVDYFKITLTKGQNLALVCQAFSIESPLDAQMELFGPDGKLVISGRSPLRDDLTLTAVARTDGEHLIRLASFGYQGGGPLFQYRLVASLKGAPQVGWLPAAVSGPGQTLRPVLLDGPPGQPVPAGDGAAAWPPRRLLTARNLQPAWWTTVAADNPLCLHPPLVGRAPAGTPCQAEAEPNDSRDKAQSIPPLCDVSGRMDKARDEDWYRVKLTANKPVVLRAIADQQDSLADLQVIVIGPVGAPGEKPKADEKTVLDLDDAPPSSPLGRLLLRVTDPAPTTFTPPAEGDYLIRVRSRTSAFMGGPRHFYRIALGAPEPGWVAVSLPSSQYRPETITLPRGGTTALVVGLWRHDGFAGPVTIQPNNLPVGVTCQPLVIPAGMDKGHLVFNASDGPAPPPWKISITARAQINGVGIEQPVHSLTYQRPVAAGQANLLPQVRACRDHWLSVTPQGDPNPLLGPPLRLTAQLDAPAVAPGGKANLSVKIDRLVKEPKAEISIQAIEMPANFINNNTPVKIPGDKAEGLIPVTVPAGLPFGDYPVAVRAQVALPFSKDPAAKDKPATSRVEWAQPALIRVVPKELAKATVPGPAPVKKGSRGEVVLGLERLHGFTGPLQVALLPPMGDLAKGLKLTVADIAPGQKETKIIIEAAPDAAPGLRKDLKLKVTGQWTNGNLPISQEIAFSVEVKP